MDPTESTLLFNETEPRTLMKRQVAAEKTHFRRCLCGVRHFCSLYILMSRMNSLSFLYYYSPWLQLRGAHLM